MKWGFSFLLMMSSFVSSAAGLVYYDPFSLEAEVSERRENGYTIYRVIDSEGNEQFSFEDKDGRVFSYFSGMKEEAKKKRAFLTKKSLSEGGDYWYHGKRLLKKLGVTETDSNNPAYILKVSPRFMTLEKLENTTRLRGKESEYRLTISQPIPGKKTFTGTYDLSEEFYSYLESRKELASANEKKMSLNVLFLSCKKAFLPFGKLAWISEEVAEPISSEELARREQQQTSLCNSLPTAQAVVVPVPRELNYHYTATIEAPGK